MDAARFDRLTRIYSGAVSRRAATCALIVAVVGCAWAPETAAGPGCKDSEDTPCTTSDGLPGRCDTTTGAAGYCAADFGCFPCRKDADCRPYCGPQAACMQCVTLCVLFEETTACAGPGGCTFP